MARKKKTANLTYVLRLRIPAGMQQALRSRARREHEAVSVIARRILRNGLRNKEKLNGVNNDL